MKCQILQVKRNLCFYSYFIDDKYGFKIGLSDGNEVTLYCNSEQDKTTWMRDIKVVIDSLAAEELKNPR